MDSSSTGGATGGDHRYPDWHTIYTDNAAWVYRMLFTYVGNQPDAEDLTAEVFLRVLKPLRVTARITEVRGYLRATTRTVLAAYWRDTTRRATTSLDDLADQPDVGEQSIDTAFERAHLLLQALPANYRLILELRFLQGRSIKDAASQMGVSVGNAKVLQHRALRRAAAVKTTCNPCTYL
uniref:RNA polymerase sigma factor n=1 Tax=Mycobacterium sp. OAE908 TaxID=2817899 RepID=UPI0034E2F974